MCLLNGSSFIGSRAVLDRRSIKHAIFVVVRVRYVVFANSISLVSLGLAKWVKTLIAERHCSRPRRPSLAMPARKLFGIAASFPPAFVLHLESQKLTVRTIPYFAMLPSVGGLDK